MRESKKSCLAVARLGSTDTAQRRDVELAVAVLEPVAEALSPRSAVAVLRRGPVPTGGIRTGYVKAPDGSAVLEQHVQLALRRHPPVLVAVRVELCSVFLGLVKRAGQGRIARRRVHRLF